MTELTLTVLTVDALAPAQRLVALFDARGGTIGRDEGNSMALPDRHRRVSRLHATVSFPGGIPTLTNSSTSLPILVGDQQLDSGESMLIVNGTQIEIGPYVLLATLSAASLAGLTPPVAIPPVEASRVEARPNVAPPTIAPAPPSLIAPPLGATTGEGSFAAQNPHRQRTQAPTTPVDDPLRALLGDAAANVPAAAGAPDALFAADLPVVSPLLPAVDSVSPGGDVAGNFGVIPPAPSPASVDPFAGFLEGIGTPTPQGGAFTGRNAGGATPVGLSVDPLAALGSSPGNFSGAPPIAPVPPTNTGMAEDFNAFALPSDAQRNTADPLAGLLGQAPGGADHVAVSATAPPIDSLFRVLPGEHADPFLATPVTPSSQGGDLGGLLDPRDGGSTDPLALLGSAEPAPALRPMRDDGKEVGAAFAPPLAQSSASGATGASAASLIPGDPFLDLLGSPAPQAHSLPPAPPPLPPVVASPARPQSPVPTSVPQAPAGGAPLATATNPDALTEAFLRGAGLPPSALPNGLTPEVLAMVGSVLRSATAGAVDMLAARAATKREVQASVTIISVQANNPLKFLPNADAALLQLLSKKMPGFMRADVAMRDAFDDLRAHEVGVIAGTRAALTEVLGKFDPTVLGDKLTRGSVLESLLPSARKAKLWDMYLERYLQIRREAEDDFQSIFGRAFVQAYERETARIRGDGAVSGGDRS